MTLASNKGQPFSSLKDSFTREYNINKHANSYGYVNNINLLILFIRIDMALMNIPFTSVNLFPVTDYESVKANAICI